MRRIVDPLYFGFVLAQANPPLHEFVSTPAYLQENVSLHQLLTNLYGLAEVSYRQIFEPAVDSSEIVSLGFKLFLGNPLINVGQILLAYGRTRSARVFDELLQRHLFFLLGVVCVSRQHDNGVGQGKELIHVVIGLAVGLVESKRELPNNPLNLLGLARQSKLAQQHSQSPIELHIPKVEHSTERMQHQKYLLFVFAEILAQNGLINALQFDDVLSDGVGGVLMDEAFGDVVSDGVIGFLVEHEYEELGFLCKFLVLVDVVQLGHQLAVFVLVLVQDALHYGIDRFPVLLQIVLHFLLELSAAFLSLSADHGMSKTASRPLLLRIELLKRLFLKFYDFWSSRMLDGHFFLFFMEKLPSLGKAACCEIIV